MLEIKENYLLSQSTTLHVGGVARYFVQTNNIDELKDALAFAKNKELPFFILGGGSNIVISDSGFNGFVIRFINKGREIISENDSLVTFKVAGGEVLDEIIGWAVNNAWCGMENLSYVPGNVAGLVIQNVNAYGHDASNIIDAVEIFDIKSRKIKKLLNKDCHFSYRSSRFNTVDKGKYIITYIYIKLQKKCNPILTYPTVVKWFEGKDKRNITLNEIREAITTIRKSRSHDPEKVWSVGSFFKNLLLTEKEFETMFENVKNNFGDEKAEELIEIKNKFEKVESLYTSQTGITDIDKGKRIKIPTAWVNDRLLNLKGVSVGGAQISKEQAITIINNGNSTADDVMELFKKVRQLVYKKTGMIVTNEPELIGFSKEKLENYFRL